MTPPDSRPSPRPPPTPPEPERNRAVLEGRPRYSPVTICRVATMCPGAVVFVCQERVERLQRGLLPRGQRVRVAFEHLPCQGEWELLTQQVADGVLVGAERELAVKLLKGYAPEWGP